MLSVSVTIIFVWGIHNCKSCLYFSKFVHRRLFRYPLRTSIWGLFWLGWIVEQRHFQDGHEHWLESLFQQRWEDNREFYLHQYIYIYISSPHFIYSIFCYENLTLSSFQEPWLLHNFNEDFYGEELHLIITGYIRPEVLFSPFKLHPDSWTGSLLKAVFYVRLTFHLSKVWWWKFTRTEKLQRKFLIFHRTRNTKMIHTWKALALNKKYAD